MTHVRLTEDETAIAETIEHDPAGLYHPSLIWHAADTLPDWQALLTRMATAQRWAAETGGITLPGGVEIKTDRDDQLMIGNAVACFPLLEAGAISFKTASGFVELDLPTLQAVATSVARHVQACFAAERAHHEAIGSLTTIKAAAAYDVAQNWPKGAN